MSAAPAPGQLPDAHLSDRASGLDSDAGQGRRGLLVRSVAGQGRRGLLVQSVAGGAASAERPAGSALNQVFTLYPAILRLTCGLAGAVVALVVRTPAVDTALLLVVVGVLTVWSLLFAGWLVRRGPNDPLVAVDVALTIGACLLMRDLVAAEVLPGGVSWVAILSSISVIVAQFTVRAAWSIPAGLLVAAAYGFGAHLAGNDGEALTHAITLLVQTASAGALAFVARRSSRLADAAFGGYQNAARAALTARAARAAERGQNRDLHDTVLSTLTVVGLGAVGGQSPLLRARAAADLCTLATLAGSRDPADGAAADQDRAAAALDERLRAVLRRLPELRATLALEPCSVPAQVAEAIAHSAGEALSNVLRHARGATAAVRLTKIDQTVVVEVVDDGPGFDPAAVPRQRYGLRESVHGRMATAGGRATVESSPGRGTRVRLEWTG